MKKLIHSNPYLKDKARRKAALRISAQTSSAVEGIRAPFKKKDSFSPANTEEFVAYWKQRAAARKSK